MSSAANTTAAIWAAVVTHPASTRRNPMPVLRVDRRVDGPECALQRLAKGIHRRDDRNRDAGGNQTIFDGRGAGFITDETRNQIPHWKPPLASYTLMVHANGR
jgi:hypothetical protein